MHRRAAWLLIVVAAGAACGGGPDNATESSVPDDATTVAAPTTNELRVESTPASTSTRRTTASSTSPATSTISTTSTTSTTSAPTTTLPARPRQAPFGADVNISYAHDEHHDYPAADIFASSDCGTPVLAASDGVIEGFEAATTYDRTTDDPSMRGGNWVAIVGADGVRYYVAHLATVEPTVAVGATVSAGDPLGTMGETGRAGACHTHFGLSPAACPIDAWWVRRGVVWPADYLDAWRAGDDRSPATELDEWLIAHPGACEDPSATGFPIG